MIQLSISYTRSFFVTNPGWESNRRHINHTLVTRPSAERAPSRKGSLRERLNKGTLSNMSRYLYTTAGAVIGYFDQDDKYLYTAACKVIAYFDDQRTYLYTQGGSVYGHVSQDHKYLYTTAGAVIGYVEPPLD